MCFSCALLFLNRRYIFQTISCLEPWGHLFFHHQKTAVLNNIESEAQSFWPRRRTSEPSTNSPVLFTSVLSVGPNHPTFFLWRKDAKSTPQLRQDWGPTEPPEYSVSSPDHVTESGSSKSYDLGTVDKLTLTSWPSYWSVDLQLAFLHEIYRCLIFSSSYNSSLPSKMQRRPNKFQHKNTTRNHRDLTNSPTEVTIVFEKLIEFNVRSATLRKPRDTTDTTNQISHFHTFPLLILEDFRKGGLPRLQQLKMRVEIDRGRGFPMIFVGHSESYVVCV